MDEQIKLKRKMYDRLLEWKNTRHGSTALLVEGARRIGKSTIVKEFAANEYESYCIVDFNEAPKTIKDLFSESRSDLNTIFNTLETFYQTKFIPKKTLIIFDEVQLCPPARSLIKYLVADGRYEYIETGSLISLKKNIQDIVIPSEEERINMFPLDFEEFLWAMGDMATIPFLKQKYQNKIPVGPMHREIMKRFRNYVLVGGMPQSVVAFKKTNSLENSDIAKKAILKLYQEDIHKYADGNDEKVIAIFNSIPGQLSKHSKRFMMSSISDSARSRDYESAFTWLGESMIVNLCYESTDPSVGMALTQNNNNIKCFLGDTGLLVSQVYANKPYLDNSIYRDILLDKLNINEGMIMENYVAQALRTNGYLPYYYSENNPESRENTMEIDFLISQDNKLNPIEVKSSKYSSHSSLDKFKTKFGKKVGTRYILHPKDLEVNGDITALPLYMASFL